MIRSRLFRAQQDAADKAEEEAAQSARKQRRLSISQQSASSEPSSTQLSHLRADCPSFAFLPFVANLSLKRNLQHCPLCYCMVCDVKASDCPLWRCHSMAIFRHPQWFKLRTDTRNSKSSKPLKIPKSLLPPAITKDASMAQFLVDAPLPEEDDSDEEVQVVCAKDKYSTRLQTVCVAESDEEPDENNAAEKSSHGETNENDTGNTTPGSPANTNPLGDFATPPSHPILDSGNSSTPIIAATIPNQSLRATNMTVPSNCSLTRPSLTNALHNVGQVTFDLEEIPPVPDDDENSNLDIPILNLVSNTPNANGRVNTAQASTIAAINSVSQRASEDISTRAASSNNARDASTSSPTPCAPPTVAETAHPQPTGSSPSTGNTATVPVLTTHKTSNDFTPGSSAHIAHICGDDLQSPARVAFDESHLNLIREQSKTTPQQYESIINKSTLNGHLDAKISRPRKAPEPTASTAHKYADRILIGCVDLWRPYCSHMSVRIKHPLGSGSTGPLNEFSFTNMTSGNYTKFQTDLIIGEMGLKINAKAPFTPEMLDENVSLGDDGECNRLLKHHKFVDKHYRLRNGEPVPSDVLTALSLLSASGRIEVRWEVIHHDGACNHEKALTGMTNHGGLFWSQKEALAKKSTTWIDKREKAIEKLVKGTPTEHGIRKDVFSHKNCCVLKAWIFLTPDAFSSRMVQSAAACPIDSPYGHIPISARSSVSSSVKEKELLKSMNKVGSKSEDGPSTQRATSTPTKMQRQSLLSSSWIVKSPTPVLTSRATHMPKPYSLGTLRDLELKWSSVQPKHQSPSPELTTLLCFVKPLDLNRKTFLQIDTAHASQLSKFCYSLDSCQRFKATLHENRLKELITPTTSDVENSKYAADVVLSSMEFAVSDGYSRTVPQPPGIVHTLRHYQLESLAWMLDQENKSSISEPFWIPLKGRDRNGYEVILHYCPIDGGLSRVPPPPITGGVLAEEMGLGKTVIVIALIQQTMQAAIRFSRCETPGRPDLWRSHGTLIITPPSLLKQWQTELTKALRIPLKVVSWYGPSRPMNPKDICTYDVVITTYGVLTAKSAPLFDIHWNRLVIDESTYLGAGMSSCANQLSRLVSSKRWAVSGTPFGDNFPQFQSTAAFLGVLPFATSGFHAMGAAMGHKRNLQEEKCPVAPPGLSTIQHLLKNTMMRHIKAQKLRGQELVSLPPATGRMVLIEVTPAERKRYEEVEEASRDRAASILAGKVPLNAVVLTPLVNRMRSAADGMLREEEILVRNPEGLCGAKLERLKTSALVAATYSSKIKQLRSDFLTYQARGQSTKFVVFTEFKVVQCVIEEELGKQGIRVMRLNSTMSGTARGNLLKKFADTPDDCILVLTMAGGACGLTLTMANVVVLFEVGLKMAMEKQAQNRVHRIGQTRPVETISYIAKNTIDENIVAVRAKQGQPKFVGDDSKPTSHHQMSQLDIYRFIFNYMK